MAIFGRRRASSNPRPSTTSTSSAATLAASQAFLANKASNANLSSAAATAALRTHTPTPTPIGQIQTKRMQRRGSFTSQASAPAGTLARPGGLQRRDSGGSMTERTFRSPSPNTPQDRSERPASSHGPYPRYDHDNAPPVPALPKDLAAIPKNNQASNGRPASVEPPQRIKSPLPKQPDSPRVSLDRGPGVMTPPPMKVKAKKKLDSVDETERVGQRSSVNFSRPMSPQNSPPASPLASGRVRSAPPTKTAPTTGLANGEATQIAASSQNTTATPVKKTKKLVAKDPAQSNDLAASPSSGQSSRTTVDAIQERQAYSIDSGSSPVTSSQSGDVNDAAQPKKKKKKKPLQTSETQPTSESFGAAYPSDTDSVVSERSSTTDRPRPYNTRAAGLLAKQPSMVREDAEGEQQAEGVSKGSKARTLPISNGSALTNTQANMSKLVSKDRQHNRSASHQTPTGDSKLDVPSTVRPASLSPGRAAHFSAQPVNEGTKHQPPGRSVSPAKSALKSSPSRGPSPIVTRRGLAPSDASDTASQYSDDGSKSGKKKKSARVSFDDGPVVVGRAASPPLDPDSPLIMSPQSKSLKTRTWIDLIREQNPESAATESDDHSVIKPTPALPSFGSVRDREQKSLSEPAEQITPSEDWASDTLRSMDTSSDAIISHVIAADAAAKQPKIGPQPTARRDMKDPLPPQVTSVEGSGYHSDEGDLFDDGEKDLALNQAPRRIERQIDVGNTDAPSLQTAAVAPATQDLGAHVPSIAVQPATPGVDSLLADRSSWLGMPGGFPSPKEGERESTAKSTPAEHHTPATAGIAEPEPEAVAAQHDLSAPVVGEVSQTLRTQIDAASEDGSDDTAGDSIYSDAAEDQSDLEGDGFGSINAIVESPTSPDIAIPRRSPPASPSGAPMERSSRPEAVHGKEDELPEPTSAEGWDRAQAYWSGLSQTRKQQLEQAALPGAIDEPIILNRSMRGADALHKKKKKKTKKVLPQPVGDSTIPKPASSSASPMKTSMRPSSPQSAPAPLLRSSMRDAPPKSTSKSDDKRSSLALRTTPKAALQKSTRPVSAVAMVDYNMSERKSSSNQAKAVSAASPATSKTTASLQNQKQSSAVKPKLQRANSDSDSSFKKARPKTPDGSRYKMKRSMRSQSSEPTPARVNSAIIRTTSPVDSVSKRPFSSTGPGAVGGMRMSMRGSVDISKPARTSLRAGVDAGKANRTKSPSRFSFISSSKAKSVINEPKPSSRFSSRFGDSSDEEHGLPTMSSSRFADSSDDEGEGLTPVRGIPRHNNEGDSTDLDDSSEEKVTASAKARTNANGANGTYSHVATSPEGTALATGSLRTPFGVQPPTAAMGTGLQAKKSAEKEKKKSSLFGSLSRKKRDESSRFPTSGVESSPRRDIPAEKTQAERMTVIPEASEASGRGLGPSLSLMDPAGAQRADRALTSGSQASLPQSSPKSPKLQRRNTPKRITSSNDISWPLPQSSAGTVSTPPRPRTSDGPPTGKDNTRPSLVLRHSVQAPVRSPGVNGAASAGTDPAAKKKKFSLLRKAFGLHS